MYVWRYRTIPPNLIPIMVLKTSFWAKPPNLMTANISGYTVVIIMIIYYGYPQFRQPIHACMGLSCFVCADSYTAYMYMYA